MAMMKMQSLVLVLKNKSGMEAGGGLTGTNGLLDVLGSVWPFGPPDPSACLVRSFGLLYKHQTGFNASNQ